MGTDASPNWQPISTAQIPTGSIFDFAGASPPAGYLLCDGASYLRTDYAALFSAISVNYGSVDGAHFNVPDIQGRVTVGLGPNSLVNALGNNDGVAVGNRRGTKHRHTPHVHGHGGQLSVMSNAVGSTPDVYAKGSTGNVPSNNPFSAGDITITSADGGSQIGSDPVDGPAYLVVNKIIKT